jgi:hypothetical protein
MTVEEGLGLMETLCTIRIQWNTSGNPIIINRISELREDIRQLFFISSTFPALKFSLCTDQPLPLS